MRLHALRLQVESFFVEGVSCLNPLLYHHERQISIVTRLKLPLPTLGVHGALAVHRGLEGGPVHPQGTLQRLGRAGTPPPNVTVLHAQTPCSVASQPRSSPSHDARICLLLPTSTRLIGLHFAQYSSRFYFTYRQSPIRSCLLRR